MRDHKSLEAWKEARRVSLASIQVGRQYWVPWAGELFRQLQASSLSIQLNIAEGHALADRGRFANHLAIAYGSAVETADILEVAMDTGLLPQALAKELLESTHRCQRLLIGLLKRYRGMPRR